LLKCRWNSFINEIQYAPWKCYPLMKLRDWITKSSIVLQYILLNEIIFPHTNVEVLENMIDSITANLVC